MRARLLAVAALALSLTSLSAQQGVIDWELVHIRGLPLIPNAISGHGNEFVAAGSSGTILSTPDGGVWTSEYSGVAVDLRGVAFHNESGKWICVGDSGTILTRDANSSEWTQVEVDFQGDLLDVYGDGPFAMIIADGYSLISDDAAQWTTVYHDDVPFFSGTEGFDAAYGKGVYLRVSGTDRSRLAFSANGTEWAFIEVADGGGQGDIFRDPVLFGNDRWVVGGVDQLFVSEDGVNWEYSGQDCFGAERGQMLFAKGYFVATTPFILDGAYSEDGLTWFRTTPSISTPCKLLAANDNTFLAIMDPEYAEGDELIRRSKSLLGWGPPPSAPAALTSIFTAGSGAFATGKSYTVLASADGRTWEDLGFDTLALTAEKPTSGGFVNNYSEPGEVKCGAYGNGRYVLPASNGVVFTSGDGITWEAHYARRHLGSAPTVSIYALVNFTSIAYEHGKFYANAISQYAYSFGLFESEDGITWSQVESIPVPAQGEFSVASGGGVLAYISSSDPSANRFSSDGVNWETLGSLGNSNLKYVNGQFFARYSTPDSTRVWEPGTTVKNTQQKGLSDLEFLAGTYFGVSWMDQTLFAGSTINNMQEVEDRTVGIFDLAVIRDSLLGLSHGGIFISTPVEGNYIWEKTRRFLNGWIRSDWYGWLFDGTFPWIYHQNSGWKYQVVLNDGQLWEWDQSLETWVWVNRADYPMVYVTGGENGGRWVSYAGPQFIAPLRWYWDFSTGAWVREDALKADLQQP